MGNIGPPKSENQKSLQLVLADWPGEAAGHGVPPHIVNLAILTSVSKHIEINPTFSAWATSALQTQKF